MREREKYERERNLIAVGHEGEGRGGEFASLARNFGEVEMFQENKEEEEEEKEEE